jgi:hypothetical protein
MKRVTQADGRAVYVQEVSEEAWQGQVMGMAAVLGYGLRYHTWSSLHSARGFPDLVLVRDDPTRPRVVFIELKSTRGQPTAAQQEWIEWLMAAGCEARCCWPEQLEELAEWLREERGAT